ncbi:MAG TPA: secretin N-terminal domain-containing protein [Candidatus Aquilonibacter sp.]|nr:secretin N-terminal domain-containing protein [Candidatus Aquilonibacter sp.]
MPPATNAPPEQMIPAGDIDFEGVDVDQVLDVYAKLVGRTLLHAGLPSASIVLKTETPLTKTEAIEALQEVLALNGISVINVGDKFVKVVPSDQANASGAPFNNETAAQLPDMGSYVTRIVQLQYVKPSEIMPALTPFAKLPNSIIPLDSNGILIIRDYAENVKRMLEMIKQVDVNIPEEYISKVIPIKYALASDIASALNSLGGSGTATVSFGNNASSASPISGLPSNHIGTTGFGSGIEGVGNTQPNGINQPQATTTPNGTPTGGTTFQQRLQQIINRASEPAVSGGQQNQIQVFGEAKIIADERSNSLLVFATRDDMERIEHVVSQLDVLLSQVLIQAVIIDYNLGPNTFTFGVSAAQNPQIYSPSQGIVGGGGMGNGQSLLSLLSDFGTVSNGVSGFANTLSPGLNYFGNIGPNWDVAIQAAENDSHATIVQQPRIQTSQAKPAQFFVGETVPYVTSTYNYGGVEGTQNSYSQLSVGVELDVTPFINPDGLVVMDIQQEIDDIDGYTTISGVGNIPNTDKRTLSSEIAVRNGDTVMLGGFIKNQKSTTRAGVPFLDDIPLLGPLFSSRSDQKQREELLVLMRPTVLKTPKIAAENTIKEEQQLPGVARAEADDEANERQEVEAERKDELKAARSKNGSYGVFTTQPQTGTMDTNGVPINMNGGTEANPPSYEY